MSLTYSVQTKDTYV